MEILSDIPFSLDVNSLMKQAHIESGTDDVEELRTLIDVAMKVGKPKAVYAVSFVEDRNGDTLKIGGISFTSRTLSRNLASSERVFP
ncbi:MAG: hypothetical protein PHR77_01240 [Kiritimatiellae bacterium]|nr:hypothetical protein [Kiritimatiellia bacterium]